MILNGMVTAISKVTFASDALSAAIISRFTNGFGRFGGAIFEGILNKNFPTRKMLGHGFQAGLKPRSRKMRISAL